MGRPQMVRKCLNSTAANNVDLGITVKEGICGDEQHGRHVVDHNLIADVHYEGERRTQWDNGAIMEGRNDGGCGQRTKYFAKFGSKRLLNQHVTVLPMQRASQQHIAGIATCTHVNVSTSTHK